MIPNAPEVQNVGSSRKYMSETPPHTPPPPADDSEEKGLITPKERTLLRRVMVFILKTVAVVLVLFMLLAFVVQIPSVQNWIIDKTTAYLSKELKTTVKIDNFKLDFFDELSIGGLYIANQNQPTDTLLYVERLRVDMSWGYLLFAIIQLDAVKLENTNCYLRRDIGQHDFNYQFIIN